MNVFTSRQKLLESVYALLKENDRDGKVGGQDGIDDEDIDIVAVGSVDGSVLGIVVGYPDGSELGSVLGL